MRLGGVQPCSLTIEGTLGFDVLPDDVMSAWPIVACYEWL